MNSIPQSNALNEINTWFCEKLEKHYSKPECQSIFFLVVQELLELDKVHYLLNEKEHISESAVLGIARVLSDLEEGIPIQYILGSCEFYGLKLNVSPSVLIPRPETEELVEWIVKENQNTELSVLDLGAGSGCISLALKKERPNWIITALEISTEAVELIKENAEITQLDLNIIPGNMFEEVEGRFDVLVSNPPYIERSRKVHMARHVVNHEPELALFVPDQDPLIYYKGIIQIANRNLSKGGKIYCELNEEFAGETKALFKNAGLNNPVLKKDLNDKWRMIRAVR